MAYGVHRLVDVGLPIGSRYCQRPRSIAVDQRITEPSDPYRVIRQPRPITQKILRIRARAPGSGWHDNLRHRSFNGRPSGP